MSISTNYNSRVDLQLPAIPTTLNLELNKELQLIYNALKSIVVFLIKYESTLQTITSAGQLILSHKLGKIPLRIDTWIVCQTAEGGYSIGDKIYIPGQTISSTVNNKGHTIIVDDINITLRFGAETQVYDVLNKTTGIGVGLTNANWKLLIFASI